MTTNTKAVQQEVTSIQEDSMKGEIEMKKHVVVFNKANCQMIESASLQMGAKTLETMGVHTPSLSVFTGYNIDKMIVDFKAQAFKIERLLDNEIVPFSSQKGKQMISFLMVVLPSKFPKFRGSNEYKAMEAMNLKSGLVAKAKVKNKKTRDTVLVAAAKLNDIYIVNDGTVIGKLMDMDTDTLLETVMTENDNGDMVKRSSIEFYMAKDHNVENLNSDHSLFESLSGSLSTHRLASELGKKTETVNVIKEVSMNGMVTSIAVPQKAVVLKEMCIVDGSTSLPFGEYNNSVMKAVFTGFRSVHSSNGELEEGQDIADCEYIDYKTYSKSMSQARSGGAVAFDSLETVVAFFLGTGQDDRAYGKTHYLMDNNGNEYATGYKVMDVAKAYKRFMLAASNGQKVDRGLLSHFNRGHKVRTFSENVNGLNVDYIELTSSRGEVITIALTDDFYAYLPETEEFILNRLDSNNAMVGIEEFKHWSEVTSLEKILKRNLTDGGGYVNSRIVEELRSQNVINSFDAFQLRISHTIKGAVIQHDSMCKLLNADIVLTDGMVKGENLTHDLREHGFQLFVVGQRKDNEDGLWIASQALQQIGLTVEELKAEVDHSTAFLEKAIDEKLTSDLLTAFSATEEESESEFQVVDYVRLAKELGDILDEQYIKDEVVSLAVRNLNKLLSAKVFAEDARVRYMFSDPIAIYNAAKAGRYEVLQEDAALQPYEVVTPSKRDGEFYQQTGKAISIRFPITITNEIPVLTAVESPAYAPFVEAGLWQGCTFFDAFSWVVELQAGADHDGDASIIAFTESLVNARIRKGEQLFGGERVLPFIDAYVKYEDGKAVEFDKGSPTYVPETKEDKEDKKDEIVTQNNFMVKGSTIIYDESEFNGDNDLARRKEFLEVVASISQEITVNTIETSLIGMIANRAMILTDLLTRNVLTNEEHVEVENDLLVLATAGRWEIDRPKHGGAYLEMPLINGLFSKFEGYFFGEDELTLSDKEKFDLVAEEKGVYMNIFGPVKRRIDGELVITGYEVKKPQWLASQKDEYGSRYEDSAFQLVFGTQTTEQDAPSYAEQKLIDLCDKYATPSHSNTAKNNIRGRVINNMEANPVTFDYIKQRVFTVYNAYTQKENQRSAAEKLFREQAEAELREAGVFRKKNVNSLTKAKKTAKIRNRFREELTRFSNARDLFKTELRKEMYTLAKELLVDVRMLVGVLYLIINEMKTNGKATYRKDGREYRFVASNGYIALPFEVFSEEMTSLLSGKISETYFTPLDVTFTLVKSSLIAEVATTTPADVKVRVLNPNINLASKTIQMNRTVKVAIKPEQQKDDVKLVMYFLNKGSQVEDAMEVTRADAAFIGFAPEQYSMVGVFDIPVTSIRFNNDATVGSIQL